MKKKRYPTTCYAPARWRDRGIKMNYFGTAVRAINHAARTNKEKEEIILSRFREIDRFLLFSNEDSPQKKKCSRKKMRDDVIEA